MNGTDVVLSIIVVALIIGLGWIFWGWVAWIFGAMDKWHPLGLREKLGFLIFGFGGIAIVVGSKK